MRTIKTRVMGAGVACVLALVLFGSTTAHGQDVTTLLSKFLTNLAAGKLGFPLGTNAFGFIKAQSDGVFTLLNAAETDFARLQFGGTTSSFPALKRVGTDIQVRLADDSTRASMTVGNITPQSITGVAILYSTTAPTISSGFGSSPSVVANNGTAAFTINVGTGGVATSGVIGLPTATTGWNCFVIDRTTNVVTRETATTTTSATLTAASAWAASDILQVSCFAY